jgi:outer membrane lipoprotein-sorting protein
MKTSIFLFIFLTNMAWAEFLPKSFSIEFEQRHISRIRKKVKKSNGVIKYLYPSRIYFDVKKPDPILYVSNGEKTWIYRPPFLKGENGQVEVFNSKEAEASKFFDSLKNGLVDNKDYKVEKEAQTATLIFVEELQKKLGIKEAILHFKTDKDQSFNKLTQITWIYSGKKPKVDLYVNTINTQAKFPESQFEFTPPTNTTIVKR